MDKFIKDNIRSVLIFGNPRLPQNKDDTNRTLKNAVVPSPKTNAYYIPTIEDYK